LLSRLQVCEAKVKIMTCKEPVITICIPTFNRGDILLKNLNKYIGELSEKWPLLIIDNASTQTLAEYNKISEIASNSQHIEYVRQAENTQVIGNLIKGFELIDTTFVIFVSDEDLPKIQFLEENYDFLINNTDIGCIRTSTECQTEGIEKINAWVFEENEFEPGIEAISNFSVNGNYLSGVIYNSKLLKSSGIINSLKMNRQSQIYYPHMYLSMKAAAKYRTIFTSKVSVCIGEPSAAEYDENSNSISGYFGNYSFGSRLDQFISFRDSLLECTKDFNDGKFDPTSFYIPYLNVVSKFMQMITLSNYDQYLTHGLSLNFLTQSFGKFALAAVKSFPMFEHIEASLADDINRIENEFLGRSAEICNPVLEIEYFKRNFMHYG